MILKICLMRMMMNEYPFHELIQKSTRMKEV
jgi:hypothetical protein